MINPRLPRWVQFLAILLGVLTLSAGVLILEMLHWQSKNFTLPVGQGPLGVARQEIVVSDTARLDPMSPDGAAPRRFSLFVWYPTSARSGKRAAYAPGLWQRAMSEGHSLGDADPANVHIAALDDTPPSAGKFPLLIFEPGYGRTAIDYSTIIQDMVSEGYVVAAITPTYSVKRAAVGDAIIQSTPAGEPDESDETVFENALRSRVLPQWVEDFSSARDALLRRRDADWFEAINFNQTGLIGHSLGGAAAFLACPQLIWCKAAVDLDGKTFDAADDTDKPRLLVGFSGSRDELTSLKGVDYNAPVSAPHMAISDAPWVMQPMLAWAVAIGELKPEAALRAISNQVRLFLGRAFNHANL
jgi:dienelactone hydrolase